jgi:Fe-S cluster biogenesis protein NfuA
MDRTNEEIIKDIKTVLEDKVKPAVAQHGGTINFMSFEDGVVKLEMAGACSGCAMSKVTLQNSVEGMLKHYVPEVQTIIGEDDDQAAAGGYTPYYPNVLE